MLVAGVPVRRPTTRQGEHTSMETGRAPRCAHAPQDALASAKKGRTHAHKTVDALAGTRSCAHATQNRGRTGKLNVALVSASFA